VEKVRRMVGLISATFLIVSCGGGFVEGGGGGSSEGGTPGTGEYYVRINTFEIRPSTISKGQSFTIDASFDYRIVSDPLEVNVFFYNPNGELSGILAVGCSKTLSGTDYCSTSVSWNCNYWYDAFICSFRTATGGASNITPGEWTATLVIKGDGPRFQDLVDKRSITFTVQ
jgi:hypothetical protein